MQLIDIEEKHPPFHVPSGMAEALLASGNVKRYTPHTKKRCRRYAGSHSTAFMFKVKRRRQYFDGVALLVVSQQ